MACDGSPWQGTITLEQIFPTALMHPVNGCFGLLLLRKGL
jgi:hypothetical protein